MLAEELAPAAPAAPQDHGPTLKELFQLGDIPLEQKAAIFSSCFRSELEKGLTVMREVVSKADHVVDVRDNVTGDVRRLIMFGSNNYLGLANHPEVRERMNEYMDEYGWGLGGPPMLNGTTGLHRKLERKLSELKGCEDTMLFSSGFAANLGWSNALVGKQDALIMDELSHASILCGSKTIRGQSYKFGHNDVDELREALKQAEQDGKVNKIVVVEGVYSMDGDMPPLDRIYEVTKAHGGFLVVDDAHGTGVMGRTGRGTPEVFGLEGKIDLVMGTFSKALASCGGFTSGRREIIDYLRFFAKTYFFSAALPPSQIAGVLASVEVMQEHPELRLQLRRNVSYLVRSLNDIGIPVETDSAILPVYVPEGVNIRRLARKFDLAGLFINAIEYPAVPADKQRFRISVMATHTREDLDACVFAMNTIGRRAGLATKETK
jgi:glycine C-acetyltransferase